MNVLNMTAERVMKVAGDPALYEAAPFLNPMKDKALSLASKFRGCKNCQKPALLKAARAMGNAFARLTVDADPAGYPALKQAIFNILNVHNAERVIVSYLTNKGEHKDLAF